ncbi:mannose-6-phosphate isomerase, class I [Actinomadura violacea]|uniref:mannose-6-phosphate isomerase n=1 Tax=Actinomadura violacea TaxID=2819934 RepID=A0ABS3S5N9_9ACTN|nr:mannose-6-phosphate isomerase, class I [Actinomadura violacea]MBO2463883.1 mannose-6-phosphate isomerase, class I [Actinomadura violacea]
MDNPIRDYAWGSRTAIAELQGRPSPTARPEAELWIGAHPTAPSRLADGTDLLAAIKEDRAGLLGPGQDRLPFLLKVLAVAKPLSIQVHPDSDQAQRGFAREEALGIPLDSATRNYRDDWPKPELVYALTAFEALCGFRTPEIAARLLRALNGPRLRRLADIVEEVGPKAALGALNAWPAADRSNLVAEVRDAETIDPDPAHRAAAMIAADHPDDPGVVASLLFNLIALQPGQALYTAPRTIHAYLRGTAVEIMASSDNVLRGGLTGKHIDRAELAAVTDFTPTQPEVLQPSPLPTGEELYAAPVEQFQLTRLRPRPPIGIPLPGPSTILCTDGTLSVARGGTTELLTPGEALFVPYEGAGPLVIEGDGTGFRASVPKSDHP